MAESFESHLAALRECIALLREQRDRYHAAVVEGDREIAKLRTENLRLHNELRAYTDAQLAKEPWQRYDERAA